MSSKKGENHMWTKQEIKTLVTMWDDSTKEEMSRRLGLRPAQLTYMANQIRKAGFQLARKHNRGQLRNLIIESMRELKRK